MLIQNHLTLVAEALMNAMMGLDIFVKPHKVENLKTCCQSLQVSIFSERSLAMTTNRVVPERRPVILASTRYRSCNWSMVVGSPVQGGSSGMTGSTGAAANVTCPLTSNLRLEAGETGNCNSQWTSEYIYLGYQWLATFGKWVCYHIDLERVSTWLASGWSLLGKNAVTLILRGYLLVDQWLAHVGK